MLDLGLLLLLFGLGLALVLFVRFLLRVGFFRFELTPVILQHGIHQVGIDDILGGEHIGVERIAVLVDGRTTPSTRVEAPLCTLG